ncbi:vacuolar sorting protein [Armillaria luteobubalina]|uniref:Vacuolar sorting protein n=1 Tax=Armillaria luteobubalina TaxID=153913 RepID=A0AA39Q978_9AGAR|nr:vacuolar sorting protein [Armillaria luteobubalina]
MVSEQSNLDQFYSSREKDFVELHDQVQTSVKLLDSLETFLSTFQKDLSAVSGQISELQDRSKDIDNRLKSRRKIEKPLSSLITDIAIPPSIATVILDTDVGEPWIDIIDDFERRLDTCKARARVKAARDVGEVAEGLRIVAASKTRAFFLALFQPIQKSVTTNMQVIQTSVILKYRSLFAFLQRQAPDVAHEIQRSYVGAARVYYETGFRRYARSLGWVKARSAQKFEPIMSSEQKTTSIDLERLAFGKIDGPSVTLAYMADDKTYAEPIEALLRSLLLVFMDNATAEYTFVKTFFPVQTSLPPLDLEHTLSPALSPTDNNSYAGSEFGGPRTPVPPSISAQLASLKEEQAVTDAIWKQIFDPVLEYVQTFVRSALEPVPSIIPLLIMIRLIEDVAAEIENRACPAAVTFMFGIRMDLWPVFQKVMSENIDGVKKLAEGGGSGYFTRTVALTESTVANLCNHYIVIFNSFVALTEQSDETMIFANLLRLRQELAKLIQRYVNQISDSIAKATTQSSLYETLLQGLSKGNFFAAHPKSQLELAYWSNLEEEARRKIISAQQAKQRR